MSNNGWSNQNTTRVVIVEGGVYTGLFFYNPTIGAGNLVGSWTAQAGTDPYGNSYPAGLMIRKGASEIVISSVSGLVQQTFITGNPGVTVADSAFFESTTQGAGAGEWDKLVFSGALNTTNTDQVLFALFSSSTDGTRSAEILMQYVNTPLGLLGTYFTLGFFGVNLPAVALTAVQPGTGTNRTTVAVAETWHTMTLTGVFTAGPAPFPPPRYRLEAEGGGLTVRLSGAVQLTAGSGAFATFWDAPAGYQATFGQHFTVATKTAAGVNGQNVVNVTNAAPFQVELANAMVNGDIFYLDGLTYVLD